MTNTIGKDWRNSHPHRAGYIVIAIVAATFVAAWLALGIYNGFI